MKKLNKSNLAVCSWSLQPATPAELLGHLKTIGIARVQIALDPLRESPKVWGGILELCRENGIELVSGMFATVGEDYSTPETIRKTGGVVPDAPWEQNRRNIQADAEIAEKLGLKLVTFHAGFLPHDTGSAEFKKLLQRIAEIADVYAERDIELGFETGQETAETLNEFLDELDRPNVGVNFDPANMILYEKGDPIQALRTLGPRLKQCHIKDATRTKVPGNWGEEVRVGTGEVDWPAFFKTLETLQFGGDLAIEREAGKQRVEDIRAARQVVENILGRS
jgi:L-ribulose-5-phosphate 3-epimerase